MTCSSSSEKPWYTPMIVAFLNHDVPEFVGISPAALARDINTLEYRVASEGESFLTKTLPKFGKAFDFALQERSPLTVSGFRRCKPGSVIPAFLQALTRRVFTDEGHIRSNPCINSIRAIRQVCYWCKKVEKGFSDESLQKAVDEFVQVDMSLPPLSDTLRGSFLGRARAIIERIFRKIPGILEMVPNHGPGTVAWDKGLDKFKLNTSYTELERTFRPVPWFRSLRDVSEHPDELSRRIHYHTGFSRLSFVEKDSGGPRLIGLEPAEYMWCQQALKAFMYHHVEKVSVLTKGRVNFTDQSINRELTSDWLRYDTLDMSSASDRNSYQLVRFLFGRTKLWPYLDACRTPGILLPGGRILFYKKFAPMGSAVCFPVEALTFYALAVSSLVEQGYSFLLALKNTFVYGDDLIVPHGYFPKMAEAFEQVGLKFSDAKCCVSGKFRESCGCDAYDGHDVTPVRLRKPHLLKGLLDVPSIVQHHNGLQRRWYRAAAGALRLGALKEKEIFSDLRLPYTNESDLPILAWYDPLCRPTVRPYTRASRLYVKGHVFEPLKIETSPAEDKSFLRISLSTKGPIGGIKRILPGNPGEMGPFRHRFSQVRVLTERFLGTLRFREVPYWPSTLVRHELKLTNNRFSWVDLTPTLRRKAVLSKDRLRILIQGGQP